MEKRGEEVDEILEKYKKRLLDGLKLKYKPGEEDEKKISTREYHQFKKELMPKHISWYESLCNLSEKLLRIAPDKGKEQELQESINACHLAVTPVGVTSASIMLPLFYILFTALFSLLVMDSFFFVFFSLVSGLGLMFVLAKLPVILANNWRLKASNQMVISVFYLVTYMRHTSNLENAIKFASDHLSGILALDFKKILWDAETEKYASVKESLDNYIEGWRKWNMEYIEAIHLIESSLYEGSESRRLDLLEKSLEVILQETFEKMLHYAQNLKAPMTMLHMLGIILPVLGLVILPLVVSFMDTVRWYHISILYNVALPVIVFYMGKSILSTRPTGYGDTDITEENPELKKYKNLIVNLGFFELKIPPYVIGTLVGIILLIIGFSPVLMHLVEPGYDIEIMDGTFKMLDYKENKDGDIVGPYGLGSSVLSMAVPLALGLSFGLYYRLKSKNVVEIRKNTRELENEFSSSLFQLGNRLGDGIPAEIAFGKVADTMKDTKSGEFFEITANNIQKLGMSVKDALFNEKTGALMYFPSKLIKSSMKVLIEASKKGPQVAAKALINISEYIKEMHRVDERLKDLLADTISSMKSQISFLTPIIAGIVIGITSMVTSILGSLGEQMKELAMEGGQEIGTVTTLFGIGIPTFFFQIIVGLYVVQIVYILTILVNGIENGDDKLNEEFLIGTNLIRATVLYCAIGLVIMIIFNIIAAQIMGPISSSIA